MSWLEASSPPKEVKKSSSSSGSSCTSGLSWASGNTTAAKRTYGSFKSRANAGLHAVSLSAVYENEVEAAELESGTRAKGKGRRYGKSSGGRSTMANITNANSGSPASPAPEDFDRARADESFEFLSELETSPHIGGKRMRSSRSGVCGTPTEDVDHRDSRTRLTPEVPMPCAVHSELSRSCSPPALLLGDMNEVDDGDWGGGSPGKLQQDNREKDLKEAGKQLSSSQRRRTRAGAMLSSSDSVSVAATGNRRSNRRSPPTATITSTSMTSQCNRTHVADSDSEEVEESQVPMKGRSLRYGRTRGALQKAATVIGAGAGRCTRLQAQASAPEQDDCHGNHGREWEILSKDKRGSTGSISSDSSASFATAQPSPSNSSGFLSACTDHNHNMSSGMASVARHMDRLVIQAEGGASMGSMLDMDRRESVESHEFATNSLDLALPESEKSESGQSSNEDEDEDRGRMGSACGHQQLCIRQMVEHHDAEAEAEGAHKFVLSVPKGPMLHTTRRSMTEPPMMTSYERGDDGQDDEDDDGGFFIRRRANSVAPRSSHNMGEAIDVRGLGVLAGSAKMGEDTSLKSGDASDEEYDLFAGLPSLTHAYERKDSDRGIANGLLSTGELVRASTVPSTPLLHAGARRKQAAATAAVPRATFETPIAECRYGWGSRPQYGDWGITAPTSKARLAYLCKRLTDPDALSEDAEAPRHEWTATLGGQHPHLHHLPSADAETWADALIGSRGSLGGLPCKGSLRLAAVKENNSEEQGDAMSSSEEEKTKDRGQAARDDDWSSLLSVTVIDVPSASKLDVGRGSELDTAAAAVADADDESSSATQAHKACRTRSAVPPRVGAGRRRSSSQLEPFQLAERRVRQQKAKMNRISIGIKSRQSLGLADRLSVLGLGDGSESAMAPASRKNSLGITLPLPAQLSADNFAPVIKGGVYEGKFRQGKPVIHLPDTDSKAAQVIHCSAVGARRRRVVGALHVTLHTPGKGDQKLLFNEAHAMQVSPEGLLLSRSAITPGDKILAYFIPEELLRDDVLEQVKLHVPDAEAETGIGIDDPMIQGTPAQKLRPDEREAAPGNIDPMDGDLAELTPPKIRQALEQSLSDLQTLSVEDQDPTEPFKAFSAVTRHAALFSSALAWLPEQDLNSAVATCRGWAAAAAYVFASVAATAAASSGTSTSAKNQKKQRSSGPGPEDWTDSRLSSVFPWGCFLAEGAFKQVYRVWNHVHGRQEAVSVMDTAEISASGNEAVVMQEVRVSILSSFLVRRRICPNYVDTFGLFGSASPAPPALWGTAQNKKPQGNMPPASLVEGNIKGAMASKKSKKRGGGKSKRSPNEDAGRYQYIGMELCAYGDMEEFIKEQEGKVIPVDEARQMMFQMMFSVYAGRRAYHMRHYDLKLLNFLVTDARSSLNLPRNGSKESNGVLLRYGLGSVIFEFHERYLVKLADFGTADVSPLTLGEPIGIEHFTTLENTPMEQLLWGAEAQQDYAKDTYSLGLAILHLFTGQVPYEELLEDVVCPADLRSSLALAWSDDPQYEMIVDVILSCSTAEEDGGQGEDEEEIDQYGEDPTLYNTFYRYLVLFGLPPRKAQPPCRQGASASRPKSKQVSQSTNAVWRKVYPLLEKKRGAVSTLFDHHRAEYSLEYGTHPAIARARNALNQIDGGLELLQRMVCFDPDERITMLEALLSPTFSALRAKDSDIESGGEVGNTAASFMAYFAPDAGPPLNV